METSVACRPGALIAEHAGYPQRDGNKKDGCIFGTGYADGNPEWINLRSIILNSRRQT